MALSIATPNAFVTIKIQQPSDVNRQGRRRVLLVRAQSRRELILLSSAIAATQLNDSQTQLLDKYLKKSEENKTKNDKERLESYYKRNYKDYFGLLEGGLKQQDKDKLTEAEKGILEWLEKNNK